GPLASWVRAAAVRTAINTLRDENVERRAHERAQLVMPPHPQLQLLRARHAGEVHHALQAAPPRPPAPDPNLPPLRYLDGLTIDEIGALYSVHRATVSKWIARARAAILDATRRRLAGQLAVTESELESLMRALRSQLEISLRGALG